MPSLYMVRLKKTQGLLKEMVKQNLRHSCMEQEQNYFNFYIMDTLPVSSAGFHSPVDTTSSTERQPTTRFLLISWHTSGAWLHRAFWSDTFLSRLQSEVFSNSKSHTTFKAMMGTAPRGCLVPGCRERTNILLYFHYIGHSWEVVLFWKMDSLLTTSVCSSWCIDTSLFQSWYPLKIHLNYVLHDYI